MIAARPTGFASLAVAAVTMVLAACSSPHYLPADGIAVADTALSGAWYQLENSYIQGQFDPLPFEVILINPDGSIDAAGIHYPTGTLRRGLPRHFWLFNRRILWSDSTALEWLEDPPIPGMETRAYEVKWTRDNEKLLLDVERSSRSFSREVYSRVHLGDTLVEPVRIQADIDIDGDTLHPFQIGSRPPGRVLVMQLDTATHISITIAGPLGTDRVVNLQPRIFDYGSPGTYPIACEAFSMSNPRLPSSVGISTGREGSTIMAGTASSGTVTITSLNLRTLRCRGRLDAVFTPNATHWPDSAPIHVQGTFDLPVFVTQQYEVRSYGIGGTRVKGGTP
ncbi:MAG: hypothetical protein IH600_04330 [Bacteroidetes bacterium]|nr:hypothetical protein [Bacteroidota bacterium]